MDANFFLKLSPFSGLMTVIATRTWVTAFTGGIIILFLSLFLGRFFCGWICPLGTTIDITDKCLKQKQRKYSKSHHNWKYILFFTFLLLAIFGSSCGGWLDPLCIAERSFGMAVFSYMNLFGHNFFEILYKIPFLRDITGDLSDFLINNKFLCLKQPVYKGHLLITGLFLTIIFLGLKSQRYWCRNLCPLGAMIGLVSSSPFYRRNVNVSDKCTLCTKCESHCKMNAIENSGKDTDVRECIECFNCVYLCPEKAISFNITNIFRKPVKEKPGEKTGNKKLSSGKLTRRELIAGGAAGIITFPLLKINYDKKKEYPFLLRPPGGEKEEKFTDLCIRCGACMKICPTNALQPLMLEGGIENFWTPHLVPRIGYCEYNCKLCSDICPTGAIKKLSIEEKKITQMGMAYIDKDLCIPYRIKESCMVCEEMCPIPDKAIHFETKKIKKDGKEVELKLPYIIEKTCTGCGICENVCPVKGIPAVRVMTYKKKEDSYYY